MDIEQLEQLDEEALFGMSTVCRLPDALGVIGQRHSEALVRKLRAGATPC